MGFARELKSLNPVELQAALNSMLEAVTDAQVLEIDRQFQLLELKSDKTDFLKRFETTDAALLERWTHYSWIRLELSYLATQRAALNKLSAARQKNPVDFPLVESIRSAIQEDAFAEIPIAGSIATLRKVTLQIVGTEHPTDPLSQVARDTLTKIANEIEKHQPSEAKIKESLLLLQKTDSIPPFRREVAEEVNRNINMVLDKLYDALPDFVQTVLDAYQQSYGDELFQQHKEEILQALEGGKQPNGEITAPILRDASWPGFDADGNENVTPEAMRYAIRLHRIRAAEKHSMSLEENIVAVSKHVERRLRNEIFELSKAQMKLLMTAGDYAVQLMVAFYDFQMEAASSLTSRNYDALVDNYARQGQFIQSSGLDAISIERIQGNYFQQYTNAQLLQKLTRFSGAYWRSAESLEEKTVDCAKSGEMEKGDLQKLQKTFQQFKDAIRDNTDAIEILDENGKTVTQTAYALQQYQKIMHEHADLFTQLPELQLSMRCFGIQLNCFGLTYGLGHVRQDSSIFIKLWRVLLNDLCLESPFSDFSLLADVKAKGYQALSDEERTRLHKRLQINDVEGAQILRIIHGRFKAGTYLKEQRYRTDAGFALVCRELERIELALRHSDMFENLIISNCETAANILEVESLLNVFPMATRFMTVVPLLEKREDLENYERILTDFMATKSKQGVRVAEVMVGYSDTERVSGLPALLSVREVQEKLIAFTAKFGMDVKIYHGPGGDANRGGLKRRDEKGTLQGNARNNMLMTAESTARFRETQFYQAYKNKALPSRRLEFKRLPSVLREELDTCKLAGAAFYEHLHDANAGLGKLLGFMLGQGAHWMVDILNSSSRASARGAAESFGDRTISVQKGGTRPKNYIKLTDSRAITATQMKELLRDNINLVMGPGAGLRAISAEAAEWLYRFSETFRDMIEKTALGLVRTDFTMTYLAFFGDNTEFMPKDELQRQAWAKECREQYPEMLKSFEVDKIAQMAKQDKRSLLVMLSRLFAYIVDESMQTRDTILRLYKVVHAENARPSSADVQEEKISPNDLLAHHPEWKRQEESVIRDAELLQLLFAWQNFYVAEGKNLDEVYRGLNEAPSPHASRLTGVGRLLGNIGAGLTSARIMLPAFYEKLHQPSSLHTQPGAVRAMEERFALYGLAGKSTFFAERREQLGQALEKYEVLRPQ